MMERIDGELGQIEIKKMRIRIIVLSATRLIATARGLICACISETFMESNRK